MICLRNLRCSLPLALLAFGGGGCTYVPIEAYIRPTVEIRTIQLAAERGEVESALRAAATSSGYELRETGSIEWPLRVVRTELSAEELDNGCDYPIRNLRNWHVMNTFQRDVRVAFKDDWRPDWRAELVIDVDLPDDERNAVRIASYCRYFHPDIGLQPTTSFQRIEATYLGALDGLLGTNISSMLETPELPHPDLEAIPRKKAIAEGCGRSGAYLYDDGTLSCDAPES